MSESCGWRRVFWCGWVMAGVAAGALSLPGVLVRASSKSDREAGRVLFREKGCAHCHGVDGAGGERGPSLLGVGRKLKADQIERQIDAGGGGMPAFGSVLQPDEVSHLVDWLKTQRSRRVAPPAPSGAKPPEADAGGSDDQT